MLLKKFSALFAVALAIAACSASRSHDKAFSEWRRNERIIDNAVKEGRSDSDEYLRAVIFFGKVTGLEIRGNTSTFGLLPNEYTAYDFMQVKSWCKKNCRYLYWDEESQSVKVAGVKRNHRLLSQERDQNHSSLDLGAGTK